MTIFTDGLRQQRQQPGIDEIGSSLGETLTAVAGQALDSTPTVALLRMGELSAAQGQVPDFGGPVSPEVTDLFTAQPDTPIEAARQRVKSEGLTLHLPDAPTIKTPALDIMIDRARESRERQATIQRGPEGAFDGLVGQKYGGALGAGTSFLVSALDPLNVASTFIPVMGEARYAKIMADAGTAAIPRLAVRASVGAAQGAVGMAAIEPIEALARTQQGSDYTMADALRSVMFGSVLGGTLHGVGGAVGDVLRARRGGELYPFAHGEPYFDREKDLFKADATAAPRVAAPATSEAPADGAARIGSGFLNPETPAPKPEKTQSLIQFLAANGGLRSDDPLIGDVRAMLGRDNHMVGGEGPLIRNPKELSTAAARGGGRVPMTLDQAREAAVELGYLVDHGSEGGGTSTTTVRTLLDAIAGELRGRRLAPKGETVGPDAAAIERGEDEGAFRRQEAEGDFDKAASDAGLGTADIEPELRGRAIELMLAKGGPIDPLDAYERAVMERPAQSPPLVHALDDLPPRAKEDALRVSIAALHDGEPVRAAELLGVAAKTDARIAESVGDTLGPAEGDWHALAAEPREFDGYDSLQASHAAETLPEPASVSPEPNKRIQAAEAAAAEAEAQYRAAEPYLPDEVKAKLERDLKLLEAEVTDRAEIISRGAACLASVAAGAAA